jgi:Dyp-type peroxidase family
MAIGTPPQVASPFGDADLASIQGLGIAGFKKDHQELLFLTFGSASKAKTLIAALIPRLADAAEVSAFNIAFSRAVHQHGEDPEMQALWVGLGVSASGLEKLGANLAELPSAGRDAFSAGMAARAGVIGDIGGSDPSTWHPAFRSKGGVDAVIIVAADDMNELNEVVDELAELITGHEGKVVFQERGETLPGAMRGHEHFGFKDGASQPSIDGFDPPPNTNEPPPIPPGELVLGYQDGAGPAPQLTPTWRNGSFLVFRRLAQDVVAFRKLISTPVPGADPQLTSEQIGAKVIGRWQSGAPLEKYASGDPGKDHVENDFGYRATDDDGLNVPTWAHIRKANPRDESQPVPVTPDDAPARRRMLRRGIPFGPPLPNDASEDDGNERGLHFIALVADLERQFEFVQRNWISNANFPKGEKPAVAGGSYTPPSPEVPGDGPDPAVGEGNTGKAIELHQATGTRSIPLTADVLRVTAGEYFFCASIEALKALSG